MGRRTHKLLFTIFLSIIFFLLGKPLWADVESDLKQQTLELESRIRELEDYVSIVHSSLKESYEQTQANFEEYKKSVETSLENYSKNLYASLEERLQDLDDDVVVLSLVSKGYKKIETNSGVFLISIQDVKRIDNGYRLVMHIGNPNFASYQGITLRFRWGEKWVSGTARSYIDWRQSLMGAEYNFDGKLDQGTWTQVNVDISPATTKVLEHIECSIEVESVQLNIKNPKISLLHK